MSDQVFRDSFGERYRLDGVRDLDEYAEALKQLLIRGRRERCVALVSEAEAYAAAELLGQFAQLDPHATMNQLAASLASRIYSRLGA
ncbi:MULTISPECIES: hypothetical protein [unclassified Amycolatopsis]|uniref:hypothetical protein n=1 Tax=unclassified Amycolatopsis TaxID=2618356 RepID=UPI001FF35CA3|nr:hypothetical protein [Amycolatopsis sp. FBCC-B4732]UOX93009.1 hypothetical protein MUY14_21185 [Amycolatopsis sp. FBCC-B4732]